HFPAPFGSEDAAANDLEQSGRQTVPGPSRICRGERPFGWVHLVESAAANLRGTIPPIPRAELRGVPSDGARPRGHRPRRASTMNAVTRILSAIEQGAPGAAERLLPLVYDELRELAARRLAHEKPGQTLQATALVHEAYLRLVGPDPARTWDGRGHFFAAAAEAMRRILVEHARRKQTRKHGGYQRRADLDVDAPIAPEPEVGVPGRVARPARRA